MNIFIFYIMFIVEHIIIILINNNGNNYCFYPVRIMKYHEHYSPSNKI